MNDEQVMTIQVGKPAPFRVPDREGCMVEIGYPINGLNVLVQYPNLNNAELKALQSPLVGYSYYESETVVPIAYWIFRFPRNMYVETTFNACFVTVQGVFSSSPDESIGYLAFDHGNSL